MTHKNIIVWLVTSLFLLVSCVPQADFDIRGEWEYTMTASDGNTYDAGSITFQGEPVSGMYLQVNIYEVEYEGEFTVSGTALKLTGYETWAGEIANTNTIEGTWSHEDGFSGVFTARRK